MEKGTWKGSRDWSTFLMSKGLSSWSNIALKIVVTDMF